MIFVTVGSRSFPFDRLLKGIDQAISEGKIQDEVFAQTGSGSYQPRFFYGVPYLAHDQFEEKMREAELIIAHGGTGVIMNALKMGKRVVAVPRLAEQKEAVDDNQTQLIRELEKAGLVTACYDCARIGAAVDLAREKDVLPYESNTAAVITSIENYLRQAWEKKGERHPKILMVSNMYPGKDCPSAGTFVRNLYNQMVACGADVRLSVMKWHKGQWWKVWAYPFFMVRPF